LHQIFGRVLEIFMLLRPFLCSIFAAKGMAMNGKN
jgi:hypothetical protein